MPDSDATRSARYRRHRAGDHSACKHAPVPVLRAVPAVPAVPAGDLDPRAELVALAQRLAGAYAADPSNWALARELRATLLAIPAPYDPEDDPLDALLSRAVMKRDNYGP